MPVFDTRRCSISTLLKRSFFSTKSSTRVLRNRPLTFLLFTYPSFYIITRPITTPVDVESGWVLETLCCISKGWTPRFFDLINWSVRVGSNHLSTRVVVIEGSWRSDSEHAWLVEGVRLSKSTKIVLVRYMSLYHSRFPVRHRRFDGSYGQCHECSMSYLWN